MSKQCGTCGKIPAEPEDFGDELGLLSFCAECRAHVAPMIGFKCEGCGDWTPIERKTNGWHCPLCLCEGAF